MCVPSVKGHRYFHLRGPARLCWPLVYPGPVSQGKQRPWPATLLRRGRARTHGYGLFARGCYPRSRAAICFAPIPRPPVVLSGQAARRQPFLGPWPAKRPGFFLYRCQGLSQATVVWSIRNSRGPRYAGLSKHGTGMGHGVALTEQGLRAAPAMPRAVLGTAPP